MYTFASKKKDHPFWELCWGAAAQVAVALLYLLWFQYPPSGKSVEPGPMELWQLWAYGAFVFIGPQVAFILRRGDLIDRLSAAARYVAFGIAALLIIALLITGWYIAACFSTSWW